MIERENVNYSNRLSPYKIIQPKQSFKNSRKRVFWNKKTENKQEDIFIIDSAGIQLKGRPKNTKYCQRENKGINRQAFEKLQTRRTRLYQRKNTEENKTNF